MPFAEISCAQLKLYDYLQLRIVVSNQIVKELLYINVNLRLLYADCQTKCNNISITRKKFVIILANKYFSFARFILDVSGCQEVYFI